MLPGTGIDVNEVDFMGSGALEGVDDGEVSATLLNLVDAVLSTVCGIFVGKIANRLRLISDDNFEQ